MEEWTGKEMVSPQPACAGHHQCQKQNMDEHVGLQINSPAGSGGGVLSVCYFVCICTPYLGLGYSLGLGLKAWRVGGLGYSWTIQMSTLFGGGCVFTWVLLSVVFCPERDGADKLMGSWGTSLAGVVALGDEA